MNEELKKKIEEIKKNDWSTNEQITENLIGQGYKKENIQEILNSNKPQINDTVNLKFSEMVKKLTILDIFILFLVVINNLYLVLLLTFHSTIEPINAALGMLMIILGSLLGYPLGIFLMLGLVSIPAIYLLFTLSKKITSTSLVDKIATGLLILGGFGQLISSFIDMSGFISQILLILIGAATIYLSIKVIFYKFIKKY